MTTINVDNNKTDSIVLKILLTHLDEIILDEQGFLDLLKHSLSLNTSEKKRVLDTTPTLSQFQFDELSRVFTEEREKFRELAKEHPWDIKKLLAKQQQEWIDLWDIYESELQNKALEEEAQAKQDEIRKSLGL